MFSLAGGGVELSIQLGQFGSGAGVAPVDLRTGLAKTGRVPAQVRRVKDDPNVDRADWFATLARLRRLGVDVRSMESARRLSWRNGSSLLDELIIAGHLREEAYYRAVASEMQVEFVECVDPDSLVLSGLRSFETLRAAGAVRYAGMAGATQMLLAPSQSQIALTNRALSRSAGLAPFLKITTPAALETALLSRMRDGSIRSTVNELPIERPQFSAKDVILPGQAFALGMVIVLLALLAWWRFDVFLLLLHVFASLVFACCVFIRLRAASMTLPTRPSRPPRPEGPFPVYSVMVPLYGEAAVVPQLVAHIKMLDWPASRLDVMFMCEEFDDETMATLKEATAGTAWRLIPVPAYGPQTKPRALSYGLPLARGEFVVIYDAEDRPHPGQLMEAYERFQREPMRTACLQSPLSITNGKSSALSLMFAFEYRALFESLLPSLAQSARFLPLGGTSNHFRREVLAEIGGWDPYNVTEDADLGARLFRMGYRTKMLTLPTLEDAPTEFSQWLPQRTRWFKGWLQTWLVHMRQPASLFRQVGAANWLIFQCLTIGMLVSAMVYPVMIVEMSWLGVSALINPDHDLTRFGLAIFVIDLVNVLLGHFGFLALGARARPAERTLSLTGVAVRLPWYWTLQSIAAWRALWQLFRIPHYWEKTPHFPVNP